MLIQRQTNKKLTIHFTMIIVKKIVRKLQYNFHLCWFENLLIERATRVFSTRSKILYSVYKLLCSNQVQLVVNVCWKKEIYVMWKFRSENSHLDEITAIDITIARLTIFTIRLQLDASIFFFFKFGYFFNQPFLSINNYNVLTTNRTLNSYFNNNKILFAYQ